MRPPVLVSVGLLCLLAPGAGAEEHNTVTSLQRVPTMLLAVVNQPPPDGPPIGRPGAPFGPMGPPGGQVSVTTIPVAVLDANLKLTEDQRTKILGVQEKLRKDRQALFPRPGRNPGGPEGSGGPGDPGGPPDRETMQRNFSKMREADERATKEMEAVLTEAQQKRLPDLLKDARLFQSVGLPMEMIDGLKLADKQKKQLDDIATDAQQRLADKMQEARQSGDFGALREVMQESRRETHAKAIGILTSGQKARLDRFVKDHPQPPDGGRPGPGGFGPPPGAFAPPPGGGPGGGPGDGGPPPPPNTVL